MLQKLRCWSEIPLHIRSLLAPFEDQGSQIAEFAVSVPLLALFVVGIFDFSGALNMKQKIGSAAQAGALVAGNQFTRDLDEPSSVTTPPSVVAIETSVFNNLANDKVLDNPNVGACKPSGATIAHVANSLIWQYTIGGCGIIATDNLVITIDRGNVFTSGTDNVTASHVMISYPHHWMFGRIITLVVPTSVFSPITQITVDSVAQNMT